MTLTELEEKIERHVSARPKSDDLREMLATDSLHVIKYMPSKHLATVLSSGQLYASERAGFTWGDAIYAAPLSFPLTTMMYGEVAVVGTYALTDRRFWDGSNPGAISLYQEWIRYQVSDYRDLTTTVHASSANRSLRNAFRTRFHIDCVLFRPDETCPDYVNMAGDWWLAITHWDAYGSIGHGFSSEVTKLKWCVVTPDAFEPEGRGYKAQLHKSLTSSYLYQNGHYTTLAADVLRAYQAPAAHVVICDFK